MEPNDLPIVCLPDELSDEAAKQILDFLYQLTEAFERHYAGQLLRHAHNRPPASAPPHSADAPQHDPPF
jgi:hypothetical protein